MDAIRGDHSAVWPTMPTARMPLVSSENADHHDHDATDGDANGDENDHRHRRDCDGRCDGSAAPSIRERGGIGGLAIATSSFADGGCKASASAPSVPAPAASTGANRRADRHLDLDIDLAVSASPSRASRCDRSRSAAAARERRRHRRRGRGHATLATRRIPAAFRRLPWLAMIVGVHGNLPHGGGPTVSSHGGNARSPLPTDPPVAPVFAPPPSAHTAPTATPTIAGDGTEAPTGRIDPPTVDPSRMPTLHPIAPTEGPTGHPLAAPSEGPTDLPTARPSRRPTVEPSDSPSRGPSVGPTIEPSRGPSVGPTVEPSRGPTEGPTGGPTDAPTDRPTVRPSESPSAAPTFAPTGRPSASPSETPSAEPTSSPTGQPSASPSETPSAAPTSSPTGQPTISPSKLPSALPSFLPTSQPTARPSDFPSTWPSASPSASPSGSPTDSPSGSPSASPTNQPTDAPSQNPTISARPTPLIWPSASPTISSMPTDDPTSFPSSMPTGDPTSFPSSMPTAGPTSVPSAMPSVWPTGGPSSGRPTIYPTSSPVTTGTPSMSPVTAGPTGSAPIASVPTTSKPTASPATDMPVPNTPAPATGKPTLVNYSYEVLSMMTFYGADKLDRDAIESWAKETEDRIRYEVEGIVGIRGSGLDVSVQFNEQAVLKGRRQMLIHATSRREVPGEISSDEPIETVDGYLRKLQSNRHLTAQLLINFTTTIKFNSDEDDWDPSHMVAVGFRTLIQQEEYLYALKAADSASFRSVQSMDIEVDGMFVAEARVPDLNLAQDSSLYYIIGGATGGALALLLAMVAVYKRKPSSRRPSKSLPREMQGAPENTLAVPTGDGALRQPSTKATANTTSPQSYFGTIESREGEDDVSTLGDPYFGEGVAPADPRADATVTESMISSEQRMFEYGVGRESLGTGDPSTVAGGAGAGNPNLFGDDATYERGYGTPDRSYEEDGGLRRLVVRAPEGKLGIVVDNKTGEMPIVHAIKETSVIRGEVQVGDLLFSVDEVECRGMSAVQVSRLISSRMMNPERSLVILRASGGRC